MNSIIGRHPSGCSATDMTMLRIRVWLKSVALLSASMVNDTLSVRFKFSRPPDRRREAS
jgi:hypothetical protein